MKTAETNTKKNQIYIGKINPNLLEMISKYTFAVALFIELTIVILDKSEYIIQYEGQWFRLSFLLFGISLITTKHSRKEWIALVFFLIIGFISYRHTGRNEIIRFVTFIWACQGKDMQRALKGIFWYTLVGVLGIMLLSIIGIYGKLVLTQIYRASGIESRYCFGMGHPNSFHCMIFVLTLLGMYCYSQFMNWYSYILLIILHVGVFLLTKSRTGFLLSLGTIIMIILLKQITCIQKKSGIYFIGMVLLCVSVAFCIYCAKYSITHPSLMKLDRFLNGRIWGLHESSKRHDGMLNTWHLWSDPTNIKYFDMGIVRIFYWYGIIPGAIYILAQFRLLWVAMKKSDYMLLALMISITLYSIIEAHFVSVYLGRNYILFFFGMYLSNMLPSKGEKHAEQTSVV